MTVPTSLSFDQGQLFERLSALDDDDFHALDFGVIGFDDECIVRRYNRWEQQAAGLDMSQVLGLHLFAVVAQCMNNFLVAQRFEDSAAAGLALDETLNFTLTLRMRPTRVRLRLLAQPGAALRFVCIDRRT